LSVDHQDWRNDDDESDDDEDDELTRVKQGEVEGD